MLTLYQFELSPYCDKVRRILRYKGVPFEVREISLLGASKHSPTRKLPMIELDGERVDDSTQIAYFLEQHFPEPPLVPETARERALMHVLEDWADESLYFYEMAIHFSLRENAEARLEALIAKDTSFNKAILRSTFPGIIRHLVSMQGTGRRSRERLREDLARHFGAISELLGDGAYLVGRALSLADISVYAQLSAMCAADVARSMVEQQPSLVAWMERVRTKTGG